MVDCTWQDCNNLINNFMPSVRVAFFCWLVSDCKYVSILFSELSLLKVDLLSDIINLIGVVRRKCMKISQKIEMLQELVSDEITSTDKYYEILENCDAILTNYREYMTTGPIDCDKELLRLPTANYRICCALITMLLREDHFSNGSFMRRQRKGQVKPIVEKMISILSLQNKPALQCFSEKAQIALNGYYVYALIDPRTNEVFYIGKGTDNRIFSHEIESGKSLKSEKEKLKKIREIEKSGFRVNRIILNWGLSEEEAFAAETALINLLKYLSSDTLTNIVAGHHVHEALTVEEFELLYGAECLKPEDIKHNILVIKINKLYHRNMTSKEMYDAVRGHWRASLKTIRRKQIKYVFGVYNQMIVAVYKPDEWHYFHEMIDVPRIDTLDKETIERKKNRIYFICDNYEDLDEDGLYYLNKSIAELKVNRSAQNPITYIYPKGN